MDAMKSLILFSRPFSWNEKSYGDLYFHVSLEFTEIDMRNYKLKVWFWLVAAVAIGLCLHLSNPVVSLMLILFYFLVAFFSIVVLTVQVFSRKFRVWYLFGFVPLLTAYSFESAIRNYKHNKAIALINQVENFKRKTGNFPEDLNEINNHIRITGLKFEKDKLKNSYRIEYLMDNYNRAYYESSNKEWGTLGWND